MTKPSSHNGVFSGPSSIPILSQSVSVSSQCVCISSHLHSFVYSITLLTLFFARTWDTRVSKTDFEPIFTELIV